MIALIWATTACNGDNASPADAAPDTTTPGTDAGTDTGSDVTIGRDAEAGTDGAADADAATRETGAEGGDAGDAGDTGLGDADAGPLAFNANVWSPILSVHCTGCHAFLADGGPGVGIAFGNLDMGDAAVAFLSLVGDGGGVLAQGMGAGAAGVTCATLAADAGLKRVVPNDSAHSLLFNKVASKEDGGPAVLCGNPMPAQGPALAPADLTTIQNWIDQGAKP